MHESPLLILALVLMTGIACQWLSWRIKLPSIIFLLGCGILAVLTYEIIVAGGMQDGVTAGSWSSERFC